MKGIKTAIENLEVLLDYPFYCKNSEGTLIHVSASFASLAGHTKDDCPGKTVSMLLGSDFGGLDKATDRDVLKTGLAVEFEAIITKDKMRRFFLCKKTLIEDESGKRIIACIMRDTTEQRIFEESLQKYRFVMEQIPASVVLTDSEGAIQYVNPAFTKISGYTLEEVVGKNPRILKSGAQGQNLYADLWKTIKSGTPWKGEFHNKNKAGDLFWEIASISPIFNSSGDIINFVAVKEDISHLKKIEENLRKAEEKNREILEAIPDIMFKLGRSGNLLDRALADKIEEVFPEEVRRLAVPRIDRALNAGGIEVLEYPIIRDGKETVYEARFIISSDDEALVIVRNITQRVMAEREIKEAREAAEAASRSKSDFLANMSHEIRTPLNSITGFIELLKSTPLTQNQEEYLDIVARSAESLLGIINDILDFSKIESGKIEIESIPFDPIKEFEPILEIFIELALKKKITLYPFLSPSLPAELTGDPLRIKQVLVNLLSNAIKFTPENGKIHVEIRDVGGDESAATVHFSVKDTGIGIPDRKKKLIFDAFSQADSSVTRRYGGTGLGLSISSRLVSLMGGDLELESHPGRGSTFYFTLGFRRGPSRDTRMLPEKSEALIYCPPGADHSLAGLLERYLVPLGITVKRISTPEEAKEGPGRIIFVIDPGKERDNFSEAFREPGRAVALVAGEIMPALETAQKFAVPILYSPLTPSRVFDCVMGLVGLPPDKKIRAPAKQAGEGEKFKGKALVVEDNPVNQKLITLLLEELGLETDLAGNGLDAYYMSGERKYDIIFMDVNMPVTDGVEATQMIVAREKETGFSHVPIVALTAMAMKGDRERFLSAGMDGYLSKPIDTRKLRDILREYLPSGQSEATTAEKHGPAAAGDFPDMEKTSRELGIPISAYKKIAVDFLADRDNYINGLSSSLDPVNLQELYQAAHRLKGAAANLRMKTLSDLAEKIETAARDGEAENYDYLVSRIRSEFDALREKLS